MRNRVVVITLFLLAVGTLIAVLTIGASKAGTVVGTFRLIGGPPPGESIPARGTVIFNPVAKAQVTSGGTVIFAPVAKDQVTSVRVTVSATGRFIAHIPTGTWTITASSPQFNSNERGACGAVDPITVKAGKSTHVAVRCDVP